MRRKGHRSRTRSLRLKDDGVPLLPATASSLEGTKQILVTLIVKAKPENLRIKGARRCQMCFIKGVQVKPGNTCGHV